MEFVIRAGLTGQKTGRRWVSAVLDITEVRGFVRAFAYGNVDGVGKARMR